jgi:hypothetical protein
MLDPVILPGVELYAAAVFRSWGPDVVQEALRAPVRAGLDRRVGLGRSAAWSPVPVLAGLDMLRVAGVPPYLSVLAYNSADKLRGLTVWFELGGRAVEVVGMSVRRHVVTEQLQPTGFGCHIERDQQRATLNWSFERCDVPARHRTMPRTHEVRMRFGLSGADRFEGWCMGYRHAVYDEAEPLPYKPPLLAVALRDQDRHPRYSAARFGEPADVMMAVPRPFPSALEAFHAMAAELPKSEALHGAPYSRLPRHRRRVVRPRTA